MTQGLPLAVEQYLTPQRLTRTVAHVLVDQRGQIVTSGGALSHFGLDHADPSWAVDMFTPWFGSSAVPSDRIPIPFLEVNNDTYAHVHFVDDGELTWIILVDCSVEAYVTQVKQQQRLDPFCLDLRADDHATPADLGSVLCGLDIGTFERSSDQVFLTAGPLPEWLELADELLVRHGRVEPSTHPVLQYFLPEAEEAWADSSGAAVPSFVWSEHLSTGELAHLQAVAMPLADNDVLLLRRLFETEIENSANVQRANNQALLAADAERRLYNESERLRVTLESIGEAVVTTDRHGCIEFMNPTAERLTGWTLPAAQGLPSDRVVQLVGESTDDELESTVATVLATGELASSGTDSVLVGRDGKRYGVQDSVAPIFDADGLLLGAVVVLQDVTEARAMVREARHQAEHDPLTGLANRREFARRVERAIATARLTGQSHAICYIDLDSFKAVNDTDGHPAGDAILQQVAERLQATVRSGDTLARVGGDEFCVLLENCEIEAAERVASELLAAIDSPPFTWQSNTHELGTSIGIAAVTADSQSMDSVMALADEACYVAKREVGSAVCRYDDEFEAIRVCLVVARPTAQRWER